MNTLPHEEKRKWVEEREEDHRDIIDSKKECIHIKDKIKIIILILILVRHSLNFLPFLRKLKNKNYYSKKKKKERLGYFS